MPWAPLCLHGPLLRPSGELWLNAWYVMAVQLEAGWTGTLLGHRWVLLPSAEDAKFQSLSGSHADTVTFHRITVILQLWELKGFKPWIYVSEHWKWEGWGWSRFSSWTQRLAFLWVLGFISHSFSLFFQFWRLFWPYPTCIFSLWAITSWMRVSYTELMRGRVAATILLSFSLLKFSCLSHVIQRHMALIGRCSLEKTPVS